MEESSVHGVLFALLVLGLVATGTLTQDLHAQSVSSGGSEVAGLEASHPYVVDLLEGLERSRALLFERLVADADAPAAQREGELYRHLVQDVLLEAGGAAASEAGGSTASEAEESPRNGESAGDTGLDTLAPEVQAILQRTEALHRQLYDLYANGESPSATLAAQDVIERYFSASDGTLPADPKSMQILMEQPASGAFGEVYPNLNGFLWAFDWLQLAIYEPLLQYDRPEQRRAGLLAVMGRFWKMLENPPESFPSEMPMSPAIAPTLVRTHPRMAAAFDNAHMLQQVVLDILASGQVTDREQAIAGVLRQFRNSSYLANSWYDWNRTAIVQGVGNQGGWATDILKPPTTTMTMDHDEHEDHFTIPGMPQME